MEPINVRLGFEDNIVGIVVEEMMVENGQVGIGMVQRVEQL